MDREKIVYETEEAEHIVIPRVAETLRVDKKEVVTGRVRVHTVVHEHDEIVDEPLVRQKIEVVRVPMNQFVDAAPEVRYEGDTMIVSVVEEVLVTERRLRVVEEVHITGRRTEYHDPQTVTLKTEEVKVERW